VVKQGKRDERLSTGLKGLATTVMGSTLEGEWERRAMRLHDHLEWDEEKAERNIKKHRVSFDDAALVLSDENGDFYHIEEFDEIHADEEDRYVTTASHPDDRKTVMRISWTDRSTSGKLITRIISARLGHLNAKTHSF
jgi:uncharacterized protein